MIRVMLADDHPITREGVKKFLTGVVDIEVVGEAENGEEALQLTNDLMPDVLLLDMEMPGINGVEVARRLIEKNSCIRILALSTYDDKQYIVGLLAAGASGYLTKEEIPENILDAVRGVARGEKGWVSQRVAALLAGWTFKEKNGDEQMTDREIQVLYHVVDGKTNKEIGHSLGISQKTVEKYLESIYSKLNVSSRVEAAVLALREGYVKS